MTDAMKLTTHVLDHLSKLEERRSLAYAAFGAPDWERAKVLEVEIAKIVVDYQIDKLIPMLTQHWTLTEKITFLRAEFDKRANRTS